MDTDEQIQLLLTKGVASIIPSKEYLEKELSSDKILTIYVGFDPTAPTLHIGHTIQLRKLRAFQDLGHKIIFLIGDFTGRIGDPTDKLATRKQLTEEEVKTNLKLYKTQASKFIRFEGSNPASIQFNNDWLGKMNFAEVLSLASHMTVDQMIKRDMFARRVEEAKPIYIHEFMYPLMQGYDSVAMNVDGEIGGNDQLFNMMAGRTLLKQMKDKEKFIVILKLLEDSTGKKMGKSEGNMVSLLDSPEDMYGKIMSWTDGLILPGFELCTDYTPAQTLEIQQRIENGENPKVLKMLLAKEIVTICNSEEDAQKAEKHFISLFEKKEAVENIPTVSHNGRSFETILLDEKYITSKSELRRLITDGAVMNWDTKEKMNDLKSREIPKLGAYKIGKNRFIKIV